MRTRGEGLKKFENFADIKCGRSLMAEGYHYVQYTIKTQVKRP